MNPDKNAVHPNPTIQKLCASSSLIALAIWFIGWFLLAGFAPPLAPDVSAEVIKAYYVDNRTFVQVGVTITTFGAAFIGPFIASMSSAIERIEGLYGPLAKANNGLGMLMIPIFVIPCWLLGTCGFRPERDAALIELLNDAGWLCFVGGFQCTFVQVIIIGLAILQDKEEKVFPRWLAFVNFWMAFLMMPSVLVLIMRDGPFAWDGIFGFWFVFFCFCVWFIIMWNELRKSVDRQNRVDEPAAVGALA